MLRTFIQVSALLLALLSSVFWISSAITMRENDIAALSSTMWDHNIEVAKNLCHQRADALVAIVLLLSSAICQMINLSWPMRIDDFAVNNKGFIMAIVFILLVWIIAGFVSKQLYSSQFKRVEKILKVEG